MGDATLMKRWAWTLQNMREYEPSMNKGEIFISFQILFIPCDSNILGPELLECRVVEHVGSCM